VVSHWQKSHFSLIYRESCNTQYGAVTSSADIIIMWSFYNFLCLIINVELLHCLPIHHIRIYIYTYRDNANFKRITLHMCVCCLDYGIEFFSFLLTTLYQLNRLERLKMRCHSVSDWMFTVYWWLLHWRYRNCSVNRPLPYIWSAWKFSSNLHIRLCTVMLTCSPKFAVLKFI
jgi:hypothetical protein